MKEASEKKVSALKVWVGEGKEGVNEEEWGQMGEKER